MRRTKIVIAALALVLLGSGVGWYILSPGWTVRRMVAAAKADDIGALSTYVDFEALRTDLKADLTARLTAAVKSDDSPAAQLGLAMGKAMVGRVIEAFVSPVGLKTMFAMMDKDRVGGGRKTRIERLGFSRFRVAYEDTPGAGLVFERQGLGWKLSGFDLPPTPPRPR